MQPIIKSHITQLPGKALRGIKNAIAIGSGKGGVGKSTVTMNLAFSLVAAGAKVGILDADIYGPSLPILLGKCDPVIHDNDYYLPAKAHGIQAMSIGFLTQIEQALIWRGPMLAKALLQMLNLTKWDNLDYLLIDLPPGTGDIQLSLVQKIPLAGAVVITTPQYIATNDAQKAVKMFSRTGIHVLGIIENMSTYHCPNCDHEEDLFGIGGGQKLSDNIDLPLLGQIPLHPQICKIGDLGAPDQILNHPKLFIQWQTIAKKISELLAQRPINVY